jgi:hypothetical protein
MKQGRAEGGAGAETSSTGTERESVDRLEQLLWALIDGQAMPGWGRQVERVLGSRDARLAALQARLALDRRLRAWAYPDIIPTDRAKQPAQSPSPVRETKASPRRAVTPSQALRFVFSPAPAGSGR